MLQNLKQWQKTIVFNIVMYASFYYTQDYELKNTLNICLGLIVAQSLYRIFKDRKIYLLYSVLAFMLIMFFISQYYNDKDFIRIESFTYATSFLGKR